jgi:hypothetical protein
MRLALVLALVCLSLPVAVQAAAPPTPGTGVVPSEPSTPRIKEFLGQLSLLSRTQLVEMMVAYRNTRWGGTVEADTWQPSLTEDGSFDKKLQPLTRFEHTEEHLASLGGMEFKLDSEDTEGFLTKEYASLNPHLYCKSYVPRNFEGNQIFHFGRIR